MAVAVSMFRLTAQLLKVTTVYGLLCLSTVSAFATDKPVVSVGLSNLGMHSHFENADGSRNCKFRTPAYRSVGWLDSERILLAFNSTPDCSSKPGLLSGVLKLAVFNRQGALLRSADVSYVGDWTTRFSQLTNGGVSIGPHRTVVVEFPRPEVDRRSRAVILSSELSVVQEIETPPRSSFGGVTSDRTGLMFWVPNGGSGSSVACVVYTGEPFKETGACPTDEPSLAVVAPSEYRKCLNGYEVYDYDKSSDANRAAMLGYKPHGICSDLGIFCSTTGRLFVCDAGSKQTRLQVKVAGNAAAALSPNGRSVAVLQNGRLEIYVVP